MLRFLPLHVCAQALYRLHICGQVLPFALSWFVICRFMTG